MMVVAVIVAAVTTGVGFVPAPLVSAAPATRIATLTVQRPSSATAPASAASARDSGATAAVAPGDAGQPVPFPLSHLAARWTGDETAVVEVRWAAASGWHPWVRPAV